MDAMLQKWLVKTLTKKTSWIHYLFIEDVLFYLIINSRMQFLLSRMHYLIEFLSYNFTVYIFTQKHIVQKKVVLSDNYIISYIENIFAIFFCNYISASTQN